MLLLPFEVALSSYCYFRRGLCPLPVCLEGAFCPVLVTIGGTMSSSCHIRRWHGYISVEVDVKFSW